MAMVRLGVRCKCGHWTTSNEVVRDGHPGHASHHTVDGVTVKERRFSLPCKDCGETYEYTEKNVKEVVDDHAPVD